jgi:hypothetical protein
MVVVADTMNKDRITLYYDHVLKWVDFAAITLN